jgi:hypothetical protein
LVSIRAADELAPGWIMSEFINEPHELSQVCDKWSEMAPNDVGNDLKIDLPV